MQMRLRAIHCQSRLSRALYVSPSALLLLLLPASLLLLYFVATAALTLSSSPVHLLSENKHQFNENDLAADARTLIVVAGHAILNFQTPLTAPPTSDR